MTDLTVRAVFTADGKQLTVAADQAAGSLDKVGAAAKNASAASDKLTVSTTASNEALLGEQRAAQLAAAAMGATGQARIAEIARLEQMAGATATYASGLQGLVGAHTAYNATLRQATADLAAGAISQDQYAKTVERAVAQLALSRVANDANTASLVKEAEAATAVGVGLKAFGQNAKSASNEAINLEQIMAKLTATLGRGSGGFSLLRAAIPGVITLLGTAGTVALAAAAGVGALTVAEQRYQGQIYKLDNAIISHGNSLQLTTGQYNDLVDSIEQVANVSENGARTILGSFVSANIKSTDVVLQASAAVKGWAVTTGQDATHAAEDLAEKLRDPTAAAEQLAKQFGTVDEATLENIKRLQEQGNTAGAQKVFLDALAKTIQNNADNTTTWRKAMEGLSNVVNRAKEGLAGLFAPGLQVPSPTGQTGPSPQDTIDAANIMRSLLPLQSQLNDLGNEAIRIRKLQASGALSQADAENALAAIQSKEIDLVNGVYSANVKTTEAEREAAEAAKERARQLAELIQRGSEQVSQEQLQADAMMQEAAASASSSRELRALQDQYEIQRATLPYVIALRTADAKSAKELTAIINALTKALQDQQKARAGENALADVKSQFQDISQGWANQFDPTSGGFGTDSLNSQFQKGISLKVFDDAIAAAQDWKDDTIAALKDAGLYTDEYGDEVEQVYRDKVAKAYEDDLARRTDWAAGVERGFNDVQRETADWASKSASYVKGVSDKFEDLWVNAIKGKGIDSLNDLLDYLETIFLKTLYEKLLGSSANSLSQQLVDSLGNWFGSTGGSGGASSGGGSGGSSILAEGASSALSNSSFWDSAGSWFSEIGDWIGSLFHSGADRVGSGSAVTRRVSPLLYMGAPRYHSGVDRVPQLRPGEVPAILTSDERVQTRAQADATDAALTSLSRPVVVNVPQTAPPVVNVNVKTLPGTTANVSDPKPNDNGGFDLDVAVVQLESKMAERSSRGVSSFTQSLEGTHGIRRTPR